MNRSNGTEAEIERLVAAAAASDEGAWQLLWRAIEPRLNSLVASPRFLGRLGKQEDDRRSIIVEVMARLREDSFHRLQLYLAAHEKNPDLSFWTWLRVVAKRVGIDYMRAHPDYIDHRRSASPGTSPGQWIVPGTLPSASRLGGERPPVTSRGTAAELLRHADAELPTVQLEALKLWIQGLDYAEIARRGNIESAAHAERIVRAAIERMRRQFRTSS